MSRKCFVFDLDGTLADLTHRLHFIKGDKKDWRGFFAACVDDTPIAPMVELYNSLRYSTHRSYTGYPMVIVSGRSDEVRDDTERWLDKHDIGYNALYMRKAGDHSPDYKCKSKLLDQMLSDGWEPVLFVDDRSQVVEMWRSLGYTCLQCSKGDF